MEESKYSDQKYEALIQVFLDDNVYTKTSWHNKIKNIRTFTEIIIRRLLQYPPEKPLTIGNRVIQQKLRNKGITEDMFWRALDNINRHGNERVHTQNTKIATEIEYYDVFYSLLDLYAYLFVDFFKKYEFGENPKILTSFSILPPIIRYKTLDELRRLYPKNIFIIDKLVLSILKVFGKERATTLVKRNKGYLMSLSSELDPKQEEVFIKNFGKDQTKLLKIFYKSNMYDACMGKIEALGDSIEREGVLYRTFEEAKVYYNKYGYINGEDEEIKEFNSLMAFVYMGRREEETV